MTSDVEIDYSGIIFKIILKEKQFVQFFFWLSIEILYFELLYLSFNVSYM